MGSAFDVTFFIFISTLYLIAASDDIKGESLDRGAHSDRGGLWFGPRLGKRSLQLIDEDKSDSFSRLLEAADILKYYYDELPYQMQADAPQKVPKKVMITSKLGRATGQSANKKYDKFDFTPRLGRTLSEIIPATSPEEDIVVRTPVVINPKSNYLSSRLVRNYKFSPRLGRDLYDIYPETHIRVARSINKTKSD